MPRIRHKRLGAIAVVSDAHPALSGSEWELADKPAEVEKPAPTPRRRTRNPDPAD